MLTLKGGTRLFASGATWTPAERESVRQINQTFNCSSVPPDRLELLIQSFRASKTGLLRGRGANGYVYRRKVYQVHRDVDNAGGGLDEILSKPANHPMNQVVRIDLTLAAGGVVYGSLVDHQMPKPLDLKSGFAQLNRSGENPDEVSTGTL